MSSTHQINPAWQAHNDLYNEGAEGFNPHAKWVLKTTSTKPATTTTDNRMLRDQRGNLIPAAKLAARLTADEARIQSITDQTAREITQAAIDHARSQLGI